MDYKSKTITFGGDFYLGNKIFSVSPQIINKFNKSDYSILNLESPIGYSSATLPAKIKAGPVIIQSESVIEVLKNLGVRYISGANNHIFDYGKTGLSETKLILNKNNIASAGFGENIDEAQKELSLGDSNISIVCTCEEEFGVAEKETAGAYSMYGENVISQIKNLSAEGKFVIVYAHGGGEKIPLPSSYIVSRYRQFVDAGAKLVIAHHPHVIQGFEEYHNTPIFYSLGNFIHEKYARSGGMILTVKIDNGDRISNVEIDIIELNNNNLTFSEKETTKNYISITNKIMSSDESFLKVKQEQAAYMYEKYYKNYFTGLFIEKLSLKIKLYKLIKHLLCIKKSNFGKNDRDEYTLLHLLRNNSHKEFIEIALKLRTGETADLRDATSKILWEKLINFIKNE